MIRENIQSLVEGVNLTCQESRDAMREIMSGQATNAQIAAFLTALRMKGETVEELVALAEVMREHCHRIHPKVQGHLVDTCGTGGDKLKTFNVSTATAFVAAGAGVPVAKHGNRSVTSKSGSADVLERLGVNFNLTPETVKENIEQVGIGFMFAPAFHPAMKYAVEPRRELGMRTVFNVLGPLTNPACANAQVLGVYDAALTEPLALALKRLGCEEAMVVHGLDGLDEVSTVGKTAVSHLKSGEVRTLEVSPRNFGVEQAKIRDLLTATPEENVEVLFRILSGKTQKENPKMDIVLVNSAAAIVVGGKANDFIGGMESARESIQSGAAYKKLSALIKASGGDFSKLEELEQKYA
ncbi:MAG: anthranilate phosphoribosyltransferase [Candidatus Bathyarchaeota archaeon]|nr:anthranilate phosphoribosyltransferase [Candidatus Bathyarchaeota archaeon]